MTTRKRPEGAQTEGTAKRTTQPGTQKTRREGTPADAPRRAARGAAAGGGGRPRIHASHATPSRPGSPGVGGGPKPRARAEPRPRPGHRPGLRADEPRSAPGPEAGERDAELTPSLKGPVGARPRRALGGPKRAGKPRPAPEPAATPEPSNAARELALALSAAALDKKAIGVEILDVTGKVDYADFLVVMTGRSDRHVHAIATGIEESMRKRRLSPLSVEGLTGATWVLIDFGDVVVHVFQEEARALYDIEGLWIDAGRIPVPSADAGAAPRGPAPPAD